MCEKREQAELKEHLRKLNCELKSCKIGLEHDLRTIVNPRRHYVANQPSTGLVNASLMNFY